MAIDDILAKEYVPWRPGFIGLGKSRIVVPKGYEHDGVLKKAGRRIAPLVLAASIAACNGELITPPPPVCEINPAVELAQEYGLPDSIIDAVRPLGNDCVVDEHEHNLITTLLPGILVRSNETIALSYPERFVGDDGRFDPVENTVMNRFFLGRYDREGLLVHPGYFELVDNGHVQIPNAYFMPIFEMPFRFDPFPAADSGGKGLPIVDDNPLVSGYSSFDVGRALEGISIRDRMYTWFEAYGDLIFPSPATCTREHNFASTQLRFTNRSQVTEEGHIELVNPFPVDAEIVDIGYFVSQPFNVRNARIQLKPVHWPISLGHSNLSVIISHIDDAYMEASRLQMGDIIPLEGQFGLVEREFPDRMLIIAYRSEQGMDFTDSETGHYSPPTIDVFNPFFYNPEMRARTWPTYYKKTNTLGVPMEEAMGVHNAICSFYIDDTVYMGSDPLINPMILYYPKDTILK
jgi:hypothetical protein